MANNEIEFLSIDIILVGTSRPLKLHFAAVLGLLATLPPYLSRCTSVMLLPPSALQSTVDPMVNVEQ